MFMGMMNEPARCSGLAVRSIANPIVSQAQYSIQNEQVMCITLKGSYTGCGHGVTQMSAMEQVFSYCSPVSSTDSWVGWIQTENDEHLSPLGCAFDGKWYEYRQKIATGLCHIGWPFGDSMNGIDNSGNSHVNTCYITIIPFYCILYLPLPY